jgi:apolipoprotein D and lipocalin family protein
MTKYFALIIGAVALIGVLRASDRDKVLGKWIFDRPCPTNIRVKQDFDIYEYIGTWYNIERYQQPFEVGADCITVSYDLQDDGTVDIESWSRFIDNQTETKLKVSGYVSYPLDTPIPGKLNVSFYGRK